MQRAAARCTTHRKTRLSIVQTLPSHSGEGAVGTHNQPRLPFRGPFRPPVCPSPLKPHRNFIAALFVPAISPLAQALNSISPQAIPCIYQSKYCFNRFMSVTGQIPISQP